MKKLTFKWITAEKFSYSFSVFDAGSKVFQKKFF